MRSGLVEQIAVAGGGYPYVTVNAYNPWALIPSETGETLANAGAWVCDAAGMPAGTCGAGVAVFGAVPAVVLGAVLLIVAMGLILWIAARHPDRLTLLVALALLALAFFVVPTRVHERYGSRSSPWGRSSSRCPVAGGSRTSSCRSRRSPTCTSS